MCVRLCTVFCEVALFLATRAGDLGSARPRAVADFMVGSAAVVARERSIFRRAIVLHGEQNLSPPATRKVLFVRVLVTKALLVVRFKQAVQRAAELVKAFFDRRF